ncbi:hypothetical protein CAEBREN_12241 [Caenorhabditis brenneri]|uniref:aspartate transaminase n=1 Tax=Caenorhabditis brenneri TaxID=135651 RepID=G0MHF3_CAEBE|nr:hypothetical protein CAEBREN_12241 [Caenorhabditis brenneri]
MSFFDPVLLLPCHSEIHNRKTTATLDLSGKMFCSTDDKPVMFEVVKRVKQEYAQSPYNNHEYLPILGHEGFRQAATELALGEDSPAILAGKAFGIQTLSGTGALRSGAEFLVHVCKLNTVYLYDSDWRNHTSIFANAGFTCIKKYSFSINKSQDWCIDIDSFLEDLNRATEKSVVVFHVHNPAGMDPTQIQWKLICDVIKKKRLFAFFDFAYQGLVSGDPDTDAQTIRHFVSEGLELFVAQSFAMNFGLYSERVGNLTVVMNNADNIRSFQSQMTLTNVSKFSNPPSMGACVIHKILTTPQLRNEWLLEVQKAHLCITKRRINLFLVVQKLKTPISSQHIWQQDGLFSCLSLTDSQRNHLRKHHNVEIHPSGNFSFAGLHQSNLEVFALALDESVRRTF